jgi:prepilin signal peptidase PulO-like enzyme (type II secretory pathway)
MKHKIILFFPLLTVLIILCCYVSFAYGFLFHETEYNINNHIIIMTMGLVILISIIFNIYMINERYDKPLRLMV